MKIRQTFEKGRMNLDVDERLLQKGEYRQAQNFKVQNSEDSREGAGTKPNGNRLLTRIDFGADEDNIPYGVTTLGMVADQYLSRIYWAVVNDIGDSYILEFDKNTESASFLLADTRSPNVLNFNANYRMDMEVLVDTDNDTTFLFFTDGYNPPRVINTERARGYGANGFEEADISVIVAPPLSPPSITLIDTGSQENNLEDKFLLFAVRYKYLDNRYSALSPFSDVAFVPKVFNFDYGSSTNESMINNYNAVRIAFNTGSDLVTDVEILFKESDQSDVYVIETFNKSDKLWGDNETRTIDFSNNKVYRQLPERQLFRYYDNVPLLAEAQTVINNRMVYGNYTENYNLIDVDGNKVIPNFSVERVSTAVTTPVKSLKSGRDYEIGIVYLDSFGRSTTVLTSDLNTLFIPNSVANQQNQAKVYINSYPPAFATHYRMFIKESKPDFNTFVPTLFYEDGQFLWMRLEGNDIDKVSTGDTIYAKADTQGLLTSQIPTKVLEVGTKDRNFLDPSITATTEQLAGVYMKVKRDALLLSTSDITDYEWTGYDDSSNAHDNPIQGTNYTAVNPAYFYGNGLDDLTSSGTYTGTGDQRYEVVIDAEGTPDTYSWYLDGALQASGQNIVAGPVALGADGVQITFAATTGHTLGDKWTIMAKEGTGLGTGESARAYVMYQGLTSEYGQDEIFSGATIRFVYEEYGASSEYVEKVFTANNNYANLEEWFYEENIGDEIMIPSNRIWFRRGAISKVTGANVITLDNSDTGGVFDHQMNMIIKSRGGQSSEVFGKRAKAKSVLEIFQSEQNVLFETKGIDNDLDVFYEIGTTYTITNNLHDGDVNQTATSAAEITLDVGNCFVWGNGFESNKIRDGFTGNRYTLKTRALTPISDYGEQKRISSLTYSQVFDQTTNYNGLNEFNLSESNYKDMDDQYGSIQKLFPYNTNLLVLQEDKVHQVLVNKDILYNADGGENVRQSTSFLGSVKAFSYEGGISTDPDTFAFEGNNIWHCDTSRGNVMRLGADGYTKISQYGMRDYFRDILDSNFHAVKLGAYDPYNDQYVLHIADAPPAATFQAPCGYTLFKYNQTEAFTYDFVLNSLGGDMEFVITTDQSIDVSITFNGTTTTQRVTNAGATITINRNSLAVGTATVTVTPVSVAATYSIVNTCPAGLPTVVTTYIINDNSDTGLTHSSFYTVNNGTAVDYRSYTFQADGSTVFYTKSANQELPNVPSNGDSIRLWVLPGTTGTATFDPSKGNRLGYYVSTTEYSESGIEDILPLATFVTPQSSSGGSYNASFTFNKPTDDSRLYLIYDYRDYSIDAIDRTYSCVRGDSIIIYPAQWCTVSGDWEISAVSTPTNGTATIGASGDFITYTHDGSATSSDSFTFTIENEEFARQGLASTQDTATITINAVTVTELKLAGGGGGTSVEFDLSSSGFTTAAIACDSGDTSATLYHNGDTPFPEVGDVVYLENTLTNRYDGQNLYYFIETGESIYIDNDGEVQYRVSCPDLLNNF